MELKVEMTVEMVFTKAENQAAALAFKPRIEPSVRLTHHHHHHHLRKLQEFGGETESEIWCVRYAEINN